PEEDKPEVVTTPRFKIDRKESIKAVALSPSGSLLTWSEFGADENLHLWDVEANKSKADMPAGDSFEAVAFSPDGKTVALGMGSGTIKLWNVETLAPGKPLTGHFKVVSALVFLSDGRPVSASWDGSVKIWNLATGKAEVSMTGPGSDIYQMD